MSAGGGPTTVMLLSAGAACGAVTVLTASAVAAAGLAAVWLFPVAAAAWSGLARTGAALSVFTGAVAWADMFSGAVAVFSGGVSAFFAADTADGSGIFSGAGDCLSVWWFVFVAAVLLSDVAGAALPGVFPATGGAWSAVGAVDVFVAVVLCAGAIWADAVCTGAALSPLLADVLSWRREVAVAAATRVLVAGFASAVAGRTAWRVSALRRARGACALAARRCGSALCQLSVEAGGGEETVRG